MSLRATLLHAAQMKIEEQYQVVLHLLKLSETAQSCLAAQTVKFEQASFRARALEKNQRWDLLKRLSRHRDHTATECFHAHYLLFAQRKNGLKMRLNSALAQKRFEVKGHIIFSTTEI